MDGAVTVADADPDAAPPRRSADRIECRHDGP
jgi:hypothetical protein